MTTIVKINAARDNFTLYIGRAVIPNWGNAGTSMPASKWQNPYRINAVRGRTESLRLYEEHIRNTPRLWASLYEIDDQALGCWCHDSDATSTFEPWCHGDVLIKLRREQLNARTQVSRRSH